MPVLEYYMFTRRPLNRPFILDYRQIARSSQTEIETLCNTMRNAQAFTSIIVKPGLLTLKEIGIKIQHQIDTLKEIEIKIQHPIEMTLDNSSSPETDYDVQALTNIEIVFRKLPRWVDNVCLTDCHPLVSLTELIHLYDCLPETVTTVDLGSNCLFTDMTTEETHNFLLEFAPSVISDRDVILSNNGEHLHLEENTETTHHFGVQNQALFYNSDDFSGENFESFNELKDQLTSYKNCASLS